MNRLVNLTLGAGLALAMSVSACAPEQKPTAVGMKDDMRPTLQAGDKTTVLVPHPVLDDAPPEIKAAPKVTDQKKPLVTKKAEFKAGKPDASVYGEYKIEVNDETKRMIDNGIRKLREEGAKGDPKAATALEYAEAAQEASERMSIQLREDGKFFADFVTGKSFGQYEMDGTNVLSLIHI